MAAAAPAGEVVVPVAVAAPPPVAAARPPSNWRTWRLRWAQVVFVLGCAAAALAAFSINSSSSTAADRRVRGACAPTDAEAAALRAASEELLLAAAAQILGATTAVLLPRCQLVAIFGTTLGGFTGYCASNVLWMLVACHGELHGMLAVFYCLFIAMSCVAYLIGYIVSVCGPCYYY